MIRVQAIDHIVLRTTDVARLVAFYSDVLGCDVERTLPAETGLTQLHAGSALIDIIDVDSSLGRAGGEAPTAKGNNLDHFCLRIEAMEQDALSDWLQSKGIEPGTFETRYGAEGFGPSIYITDPDHNTVELRFTTK